MPGLSVCVVTGGFRYGTALVTHAKRPGLAISLQQAAAVNDVE